MTGRTRLLLLPVLVAVAPVQAAAAPATAGTAEPVVVRVSNNQLLTSAGEKVTLLGLVRGSRKTVLSFTFSSCSTVCPVSDIIMHQVDKLSRDRGAADLRLITITIDPAADTPHKLAKHAAKLGPAPRRTWLTGDHRSVLDVLDGLGMQFGSLDEHGAFFLVFAPQKNKVVRMRGAPSPRRLLEVAEAL